MDKDWTEFFRNQPAVDRATLFGSWARGEGRRDSDLDIAVELNNNDIETWDNLAFHVKHNDITLRPVDLINMDEAHDALKQEILTTGKIIYDRHKII